MTIEDKLTDALFDLIEMHTLARKPLLKSSVRECVAEVMASEREARQQSYNEARRILESLQKTTSEMRPIWRLGSGGVTEPRQNALTGGQAPMDEHVRKWEIRRGLRWAD